MQLSCAYTLSVHERKEKEKFTIFLFCVSHFIFMNVSRCERKAQKRSLRRSDISLNEDRRGGEGREGGEGRRGGGEERRRIRRREGGE